MSAPWELTRPDDLVILTVDIADSPLAELLVSEIYDVKTSTLLDDYHNTLQNYVLQQLKETTWLDDQTISSFCNATFRTFMRKENGDILCLRKPALQRKIGQILRSRMEGVNPIVIPLLVRFMIPGLRQRSLNPLPIPSVVSLLLGASTNKDSTTVLPEAQSPTSYQEDCGGCDSYSTMSVLVDTCGVTIAQSRHDLQSTRNSAYFVARIDDICVQITPDRSAPTSSSERERTTIFADTNDMEVSLVCGDLDSIYCSKRDNIGEGIGTSNDKIVPSVEPGKGTVKETDRTSMPSGVHNFGTCLDPSIEDNSADCHTGRVILPAGEKDTSNATSNYSVESSDGGITQTTGTNDNPIPIQDFAIQLYRTAANAPAIMSLTDTIKIYGFVAVEPGKYDPVETNLLVYAGNNVPDHFAVSDGDTSNFAATIDDSNNLTVDADETVTVGNDCTGSGNDHTIGTVMNNNANPVVLGTTIALHVTVSPPSALSFSSSETGMNGSYTTVGPVLSVKVPPTFPSRLLDIHLQTPFADTTATDILRLALLSQNQEQQYEALVDGITGSIAVSNLIETFCVMTLSHEASTDDSFIALNPSRQLPGYVSDIAAAGVVHFANGHFALVLYGVAANITRVAIRDTSAGSTPYGVPTIGYSVVHSTFVARYDEGMCSMGTEWTLLHCDHQHRAHCMAPLASTVVHTRNDRDCNDDCRTNTCSPAPVEITGHTSLFASMRMKYRPFDRGRLIMDQAAASNTDNCPGSLTEHVVSAMVVDANNVISNLGPPITLQYSPDNAAAITTATTEACVF